MMEMCLSIYVCCVYVCRNTLFYSKIVFHSICIILISRIEKVKIPKDRCFLDTEVSHLYPEGTYPSSLKDKLYTVYMVIINKKGSFELSWSLALFSLLSPPCSMLERWDEYRMANVRRQSVKYFFC